MIGINFKLIDINIYSLFLMKLFINALHKKNLLNLWKVINKSYFLSCKISIMTLKTQ